MAYYDYFKQFRQMSPEELRRKAEASMENARAKGRSYEPVILQGRPRQICKTWWGDAWCRNLERYADFASRIDRGKRYVRSGAVVDLKIHGGDIKAKVQGSRRTPYTVEIKIDPLPEKQCREIEEKSLGKIKDLAALAGGEFPEELEELFCSRDGLFPTPDEIHFSCSCPDWAYMCKHVTAVMYGIGVRLDENPFYFFPMRGLDVDRLIDKAIENRLDSMLSHADVKSPRIMQGADLLEIFGVEQGG
ncbi:MAG: hypothetical protein IKO94_03540 [Selenomonadaceae bacterium]|nr:hypothetical protein [Selenomonadaceae bacterium]